MRIVYRLKGLIKSKHIKYTALWERTQCNVGYGFKHMRPVEKLINSATLYRALMIVS